MIGGSRGRLAIRAALAGQVTWAMACLAALAPVGVAAAQPGAAPTPSYTWIEAVRAHVPGEADPPLEAVAAMPIARIKNTVRHLARAEVPLLTRALVLHTDIAILQREVVDRPAGSGHVPSIVLVDGRHVGQRERSEHWAVAIDIAQALSQREGLEGPRVAGLWFRAVCALFQHWAECTLLYGYVNEAIYLWPAEARLYLYRGTLHQTMADPRVQHFLRSQVPPSGPYVVSSTPGFEQLPTAPPALRASRSNPVGTRSAGHELALAEADLRRSLELDPSLVEARIRLAHVVGDRGHADQAVTLATEALAVPLPPFFEVYAALILGRGAATLQRWDVARAAFERAAARAPDAQSPRVGLAQVALAEGRPAQGLEALMAVGGPGTTLGAEDPWWNYFGPHDPDVATLLAELRDQVR